MPSSLNLFPSGRRNNLFTASYCTGMKAPMFPTSLPPTSSDRGRPACSALHPILRIVKGSPPHPEIPQTHF